MSRYRLLILLALTLAVAHGSPVLTPELKETMDKKRSDFLNVLRTTFGRSEQEFDKFLEDARDSRNLLKDKHTKNIMESLRDTGELTEAEILSYMTYENSMNDFLINGDYEKFAPFFNDEAKKKEIDSYTARVSASRARKLAQLEKEQEDASKEMYERIERERQERERKRLEKLAEKDKSDKLADS